MDGLALLGGVLGLSLAAPLPDDSASELKRFQGTWVLVRTECDGIQEKGYHQAWEKDRPCFVIEGERLLDRKLGSSKGTLYRIAKLRGGEIDLVPQEGPMKGWTLRGIYALEGDELKVCREWYSTPDGAGPRPGRPAEFKAPEGSGHFLHVLKRWKPTQAPTKAKPR